MRALSIRTDINSAERNTRIIFYPKPIHPSQHTSDMFTFTDAFGKYTKMYQNLIQNLILKLPLDFT